MPGKEKKNIKTKLTQKKKKSQNTEANNINNILYIKQMSHNKYYINTQKTKHLTYLVWATFWVKSVITDLKSQTSVWMLRLLFFSSP